MGTPFSYTDPTVPVFQDPAVKLTNQDQAKPGLSHQSQRFVWTEGIEPGFPACGTAIRPQSYVKPPTLLLPSPPSLTLTQEIQKMSD